MSFGSSIVLDLVLTFVTCGVYHLFIQNRKIKALNSILSEKKYSFLRWALFALLTCGIYHIYHQYVISADLETALGRQGSSDPLLLSIITAIGLGIAADAIFQHKLNTYYKYDFL